MSINVQVKKSVTQNPSHHGNNNVIAIDIRYNNYIEGVFNESLLFALPIEDDITWDKIFGTENGEIQDEPDCWFAGQVEEYLAELDMGFDADMEVIEKIAEGYLEMKETRVDVELGSSSCLRVLSVVVEIGGMNNVKGIRAFLETCGVSFGKVSSSIGDRCAICLETMEEKEVATLRCNHVFHGDCVVEMVHKGRVNNATATDSCPLCRTEFIAFSNTDPSVEELKDQRSRKVVRFWCW